MPEQKMAVRDDSAPPRLQVSRVTDLMELLDSVQEFKQGEYAKNFCDGETSHGR